MPKQYFHTAFTGGEISPEAQGRINTQAYGQSVHRMRGFLPMRQGGVHRLPGTYYLNDIASTLKARVYPYHISDVESIILVFNDGHITAYDRDGTELDSLIVTYTEEQIPELDFSQPGSKLYIAHKDHELRTLEWDGSTLTLNTPTLTAYDTNDWSTEGNFPRFVEHYEGRMLIASTEDEPMALWGSKVLDYHDFSAGTTDTDGWKHVLSAAFQPRIQWLIARDNLIVGTTAGPFKIGTIDQPLTPNTIFHARQQTGIAAGSLPALIAGESVYFVQKATKFVRRMHYRQESQSYKTDDVTYMAEHITGDGIHEWAYQSEPQTILWCVRKDGKVASFTIDESFNVWAWALHDFKGAVESVAVGNGTAEDDVFFIVKRNINGTDVRYIERLAPLQYEDRTHAHFVFAGVERYAGGSAEIDDITQANPAVLTPASGHGFSTGDYLEITGVEGMEEINDRVVKLGATSGSGFQLETVDGTNFDTSAYTAYTGGGTAQPVIKTFDALSHLEGETVGIFGDGATYPDAEVDTDTHDVEAQDWITRAHIGIPQETELVLLPIAQVIGQYWRPTKVNVHVVDTMGLYYGQYEVSGEEIDFRHAADAIDTPVREETGRSFFRIPWNIDPEAMIEFRAVGHAPANIVGAQVIYEVYG